MNQLLSILDSWRLIWKGENVDLCKKVVRESVNFGWKNQWRGDKPQRGNIWMSKNIDRAKIREIVKKQNKKYSCH